MSHEHGTYLRGIRDIEALRVRCRIDEDTNCWHWIGAFDQGIPKVWIANENGGGMTMTGYRAAKFLVGKPVKPRMYVWNICKHADCVNPNHSKTGTRAEMFAWKAEHGLLRQSPSQLAAATRNGRSRSVLDEQKVLEIRASGENNHVLGARYGVHHSTISKVKRGQSWVSSARGSSVFNWGGML